MPATAPRLMRRVFHTLKREATYGVDSSPSSATDGLLYISATFTPDLRQVPREVQRPFLGSSEVLAGAQLAGLETTVEMAPSGTAGTAPKWEDLFLALGFAAATLATPARIEYTPVSDLFKSATFNAWSEGVKYVGLGALGTGTIDLTVGNVPKLTANLTALYGGESAATTTAGSLAAWKAPVVVSKVNVVDITLGCAYAAGALTGGTVVPSRGLTIDIGNQVEYIELASSDYISITDRKAKASVTLDLTAAQEVTQLANVKGATTQGIGFTVGTTAGNKMIFFFPSAQFSNPRPVDVQGVRLMQFDVTLIPSAAGNDEMRIILL